MIYINKNDLNELIDDHIYHDLNESIYIIYSKPCYNEIIKYFNYKDINLDIVDGFGSYNDATPLCIILLKKNINQSNDNSMEIVISYSMQKYYVKTEFYDEDIIWMGE